MRIRKATDNDHDRIIEILKEVDLWYEKETIKDFWVADKDGRLIGTVKFEEHPDFFFLSSLGVVAAEEKRGIGKALVSKMFEVATKDIYLYTIIPQYFEKLGFKITASPPDLPSKKPFCEDCFPGKCVTMVKKIGHPEIKGNRN